MFLSVARRVDSYTFNYYSTATSISNRRHSTASDSYARLIDRVGGRIPVRRTGLSMEGTHLSCEMSAGQYSITVAHHRSLLPPTTTL